MSSGNYHKYEPKSWFSLNRDEMIDTFNRRSKVSNRKARIKKLEKILEQLYNQNIAEWDAYRDACVAKQKILK